MLDLADWLEVRAAIAGGATSARARNEWQRVLTGNVAACVARTGACAHCISSDLTFELSGGL